jgi:integrase
VRIRRDAGLADLRLHDLRHHFISVGASSGESRYVLGKVAGHKQAATTQHYANLANDPVKRAVNGIARQVPQSMNTGDG